MDYALGAFIYHTPPNTKMNSRERMDATLGGQVELLVLTDSATVVWGYIGGFGGVMTVVGT